MLISYRNNNYRYHTFFRIINHKSKKLKYEKRNTIIPYCHNGQRKLLFSEIEFITLLSKQYDLNNIIILYIGAAAGYHLTQLFELFPESEFILCDPNQFKFKNNNTNKIHIINELYTDDTIQKINDINSNNKFIALISDIRRDTDEHMIFNDMIKQQYWVIQANAIAYMLKLRFPYIDDNFSYTDFTYNIDNIKKYISVPKIKSNKILYLSGNIYTQIYPPGRSSETRLIYIKANPNDKYKLIYYDPLTYEQKLNYFNTFDRNNSYIFKNSQMLKYHLIGYDDGYESVVEYYIIYNYLKYYKKINPNCVSIIKLLYDIDHFFRITLSNDIINCLSLIFKSKKEVIDFDKNDIDLFNSKIYNSLTYQIKSFKFILKHNDYQILTNKQYYEQINIANIYLNKYNSRILSRFKSNFNDKQPFS